MKELKKQGKIPSSDIELKALIAPLAEAKEEFSKIVMENTQEAIRAGMERTKAELKKQGMGKSRGSYLRFYLNGSLKASIAGLDFEEFSKEVSQRLKEQTFVASEQTIDRMSGNVMENLRESYEGGYGIDKAAGNLEGVFDNMEGYELERVARTEINGAQNRGAEATELQLGIQYDKWKTAGDERVRGNRPEDAADHTYMDGQISKVGGNFSNGLSRPGDRTGPIEEWINCRCVLVPYLIPEGYVAPEGTFFYEEDLIKLVKPKPEPKPKPGTKPKPRQGDLFEKPKPIREEIKSGKLLRENLAKAHQDDYARYDNLTEMKKLLNKEWDKMWKGRPPQGTPEYEIWNKEYAAMVKKMRLNEYEKAKIRKLIKEDLREKVIFNKEGFEIGARIPTYEQNGVVGFSPKPTARIKKSVKEFSKLIDEKLWPKDTPFRIQKIPPNGRAFHRIDAIHITEKESTKVVIHEMGHHLEKKSPGMYKKVKAFFDMRTEGEVAEWLGRGFGPDEFFKKDKFIDKYMGKVYEFDSTEVLSMGMEYIYNNPMKLMQKDPEMFDFIIDIIRGNI